MVEGLTCERNIRVDKRCRAIALGRRLAVQKKFISPQVQSRFQSEAYWLVPRELSIERQEN